MYDYLYKQIIDGTLPPGHALSEVELAEKLNKSRTPVREALMALESVGIAKRYPGRGCFVTEVEARDVEEVFELREIMELCALRSACFLIPEKDLEKLENALKNLRKDSDPKDYFDTDRQLHSLILNYCGNRRLYEFVGIINAQIERVRVVSSLRPARLDKSLEEHLALVSAIKERNLDEAERLLSLHIRNVRDSSLSVVRLIDVEKLDYPVIGWYKEL